MNATTLSTALQPGNVARLNLDAGFGYVRAADGGGTWIFVAQLVTHRVMRQLQVGQSVAFELDGRQRVVRLVPAQGLLP